jgi:hypothetical protein
MSRRATVPGRQRCARFTPVDAPAAFGAFFVFFAASADFARAVSLARAMLILGVLVVVGWCVGLSFSPRYQPTGKERTRHKNATAAAEAEAAAVQKVIWHFVSTRHALTPARAAAAAVVFCLHFLAAVRPLSLSHSLFRSRSPTHFMSVSLATRPMHRDGALTHTAYARTHGDDDTPPPRSLPSLPHAREGETERMRRVAKTTINEREFHQTEGLKEATARLCVCEGCAMRHRDTRARAHVPLSLTHSQTLTQRHSHRDTHTHTQRIKPRTTSERPLFRCCCFVCTRPHSNLWMWGKTDDGAGVSLPTSPRPPTRA